MSDVALARQANDDALSKLRKVEGRGAGLFYTAPEMGRLFEGVEQIVDKAGKSFVTAERLLLNPALATTTPALAIMEKPDWHCKI